MKLLTKEQEESYGNAESLHICKEKFGNNNLKDEKYCKVRDHCYYTAEYRGTAHSMRNLKYILPKNIPIDFHNGSNYDYHFIIKGLAVEFKKAKQYLTLVQEKTLKKV